MSTRCAALLCAVLPGATVFGGEISSLDVRSIAPGSHLEIATVNRIYRAEVVDPASGETRMTVSDGTSTTADSTTVYLLGATQGRVSEAGGLMLVKMGELRTGMRLELGVGSLDESRRVVTEAVQSLRVE